MISAGTQRRSGRRLPLLLLPLLVVPALLVGVPLVTPIDLLNSSGEFLLLLDRGDLGVSLSHAGLNWECDRTGFIFGIRTPRWSYVLSWRSRANGSGE